MANLIRLRKAHHYGLGGFPHERLHQDTVCLCVSINDYITLPTLL
ncbi:hypothetical protein [Moorena sp. SIO3H5]|nr:hypothetical protein [Moorena sp. SIO3H5]